jgi:tetrahydromethanopterin S-methyltransferase subunit C
MALVDRVKNILLTPKTEWQVIDAESTTVGDLYKGYIIPLAAIGPIAQAIGWSVFGMRVPFLGSYRTPIGTAITQAVVTYVLTLIGVYVLAIIIDKLAPTFSGTPSQIQALKVSAYSSTASWVASIFTLIPALSILSILGVYSLYLLYLGLPVLMKSPAEKALSYTVVVILCAIVLFLVIGYITSLFVRVPMG